jgi:integrase
MKLTSSGIASLTCPPGRTEVTYFCDDLPGFGYRIRSSGVKRWVVQYEIHGRTRRVTIGSPDLFSAEEARRIARQHLAKKALGIDAAAEKAEAKIAAKLTLGSVVDDFLADRKSKLRPSSMATLRRDLLRWWKPLHRMPLNAVTRRHVAVHLVGPPTAAARARVSLMRLYAWAIKQGLIDANPVINTPTPDEHVRPRERVLSNDELVAIWQASGDGLYGAIIKLLILSGCRRQEVGSMRWDELNNPEKGLWTIPSERTKNGKAHALPLPEMAWSILADVPHWRDGAFVFGQRAGFQAWAVGKQALDRRLDIAPWVVHDIRRSVATGMNEIGIQPHIVEAILNHATFRKGVAAIYNRASYERDMRTALALWADHVRALVEGEERKIIPYPLRS